MNDEKERNDAQEYEHECECEQDSACVPAPMGRHDNRGNDLFESRCNRARIASNDFKRPPSDGGGDDNRCRELTR